MALGTAIVLITVGAILKYAVNAEISGIELDTVGTILLVVGVIGLVISLIYMTTLGRRGGVVREREVLDDRPRDPRY